MSCVPPTPATRTIQPSSPNSTTNLQHYVGRPSPVYHARRWSDTLGGAQIYLKREDLNHTGAHKINNCIGQALLARRMGKPRVIAETGAGQHGVATATVAARYGMECVVYMGSEDVKRQAQNVYRMKLLGATVVPVESGSKTLKDALNEAMRDWVTNVGNTFYIIGTVAGPHPYPMMVRDFQTVIGKECIEQMPDLAGRQPDAVIACVGGGSNAMGIFFPYIAHEDVRLIGVEAAGDGIETGHHSASLTAGRPGVLHGNRTYLLQDENGQIIETHSISAGLDYPGVGPEHAWLKDSGRAEYVTITDAEALEAFHDLCRCEGIIPALESSHALAYAAKLAPTMPKDKILLVNLSGRGDKDMHTVAEKIRHQILMSRISRKSSSALQLQGRKALIPFITAGDPDPAGDRAADARAGGRRCRHHRTRRAVFRSDGRRPDDSARIGTRLELGRQPAHGARMVAEFRKDDNDTPVVLMGYANPIEAFGVDAICGAALEAASMVCWSLIIRRKNARVRAEAARDALDPIFLLAPTSLSSHRDVAALAAATSITFRSRA